MRPQIYRRGFGKWGALRAGLREFANSEWNVLGLSFQRLLSPAVKPCLQAANWRFHSVGLNQVVQQNGHLGETEQRPKSQQQAKQAARPLCEDLCFLVPRLRPSMEMGAINASCADRQPPKDVPGTPLMDWEMSRPRGNSLCWRLPHVSTNISVSVSSGPLHSGQRALSSPSDMQQPPKPQEPCSFLGAGLGLQALASQCLWRQAAWKQWRSCTQRRTESARITGCLHSGQSRRSTEASSCWICIMRVDSSAIFSRTAL